MKKVLFLISFLANIIYAKSQTQPGVVTISSNIAGIECMGLTSFVIDNAGNKWLGFSNNGNPTHINAQLMRYNGTQWDTFPHIPGNKVNALAVDATNNIWVGGNQGLTKFDGTSYTTYNTSNSTVVNDTIISLAYGNGNVYVGTHHGLSVFNGTTFVNYNRATNGMKSDTVNCITVESPTAVWLGNQKGIDKFDGANFSFKNINDKITCIYIDNQQRKWLGTSPTGNAWRYNDTTFVSAFDLIGGYPAMQEIYCNGYSYAPCGYSSVCNYSITICKGPKGGVYLHNAAFEGSIEIFNDNSFLLWQQNTGLYNKYDNVSGKVYGVGYTTYTASVSYIDTAIWGGSTGTGCAPVSNNGFIPWAKDLLDINNVSALIMDGADGSWDVASSVSAYSVPKKKGNKPLFASSFWMGGYNNNSLHTAAMTYRQNGYDFWCGPLDTTNASFDTTTALSYNRLWKINRFDIANFIYNWGAGNVQSGSFTPAANILSWPANSTGNYSRNMAPYVDLNNNGVYDPIHDGDYPLIKGDQMIWWVFNDNIMNHTETGGKPFGVEVHASAYAFTCPGIADSNAVLNNTIFYNYKIYNRSQNQYDSCYVTAWMDTDLGYYNDDYIGCDVMNNFGYVYNGDNYDEDAFNTPGYHDKLPAFACNILNGPYANINDGLDNNNNGVIDEPNEKCLQSVLTYYNNTGSSYNGNPTGAMGYYNLMSGKWENGASMTYGSQGLNSVSSANPKTKFMYPGNSDPYGISFGGSMANPVAPPTDTVWTEITAGNQVGDRRFLSGIGPFSMQPHGVYEVDWAYVFSQDTINCIGNNTCILPRMVQDNKRVKYWFDNNNFPSCLNLSQVGIKQNNNSILNCKLYPNPANDNLFIEFSDSQKNTTIEVYDIVGKLISGFQYNDGSKYFSVPVSNLASGVYVIKIKSGAGYTTQKFIKQ